MESSQFINQQRLSKKQLQLHLQQQQQNQKYYLDSSTNSSSNSSSTHDNYQQQQSSRCQYFTTVTTPPTSHFAHPSSEYATNHHHHQHHNHQTLNHFASGGGSGEQMSPTSTAHRCCSNVKKYHHHQSESNNIEVCTIESQHSNHVGVVEPSIKWNRRNISATMEKYEPTMKHRHHHHSPTNHHHRGHMTLSHIPSNNNNASSPHQNNYLSEIQQSDYAYAYYEPGAPMRHQNIPSGAGYYEEAGPSRPPPPNSIRAILSTARRNAMQRNNERNFSISSSDTIAVQSQVGQAHPNPSSSSSSQKQQIQPQQQTSATMPQQQGGKIQENLYEEIPDAEKKKIMMNSDSIMSLNQCLVEEEFRRVHHRHRRVLDELNLDVEEMLMPSTQQSHSPSPPPPQPAFIQTSPMSEPTMPSDTMDFLGNSEETDGSNGAGNYSISNNMDLDSGFSGSNSSYIGSLRYQKSTTPTTAAALALNTMMKTKAPAILELPINHQHTDSSSSFYGGSMMSATDEIAMISLSSRSSSSNLYDSAKMMNKLKALSISPTHHHPHLHQNYKSNNADHNKSSSGKFSAFFKGKGWKSKLPGFSSTSNINKIGVDEQKSISWEDPLPRSNSISGTTNISDSFNPQSVTRKSSNSILSLGQRHHHSYNLNSVNNNNHEASFFSSQLINLNSLINNNHLINTSSPTIVNHHHHTSAKRHRKLEHTPSSRSTVSSEDSWCPSETDHEVDDISSCNDDDETLSERSSSSLISSTRNSQLRLTFNKAKQHLSFDKWRSPSSISSSSATMPSSNAQDSTVEPLSRLSRWFSIRRGSNNYDLSSSSSTNNSPNRSGSIEKDNDDKLANGKKMPQLQETEEDCSQIDGTSPSLSNNVRSERRTIPLALPSAPPAGLSPSQLKRRHIISAIIHSENSYVLSMQRLVNDYKKPLEDSNPPILNSSKASILFHRVADILQCHTLFRIALNECIRNWDRDEKIGDVFMSAFSKTSVLDVYSGFINNFSNAMDLAKVETKRKSAFADFLNVKQISSHDRLSFFGLMVKPVQRFPQFILFLQDLLKHTPQGHHDRMSLQMALTQLESLADSLNERKREAEQYQAYKEMLGQISGPFNSRFASSTDQRHNYLLREDNVTQLEFSQNGLLVKSKPRRLLLANDKVICVTVAPKQSQDFGSTEKLTLKWMYHVNDVEIVDNSSSATLNRYITSGLNRGGSLKSNHSGSGNEMSMNSSQIASQMTNGAENLANEMSSLMHDYNMMSRINDLVGQLKGDYPEINLNITRNVLNTIQTSIRKKDEEMSWVDSCMIQLIVKQKSGKEETLTFRADNPSVKREWITELRLAQFALDPNNSPAWEVGDRDNHRPLTKMPLFVRMHPVYKSTQHQTEVRCGCYYSMSPESKFQKRATKNRYYLWVCSVDGSNSHITILLHQPHQAQAMIKDVTAFTLADTVITTMDHVKGRIGLLDGNPSQLKDVECVWLGTSDKKIIVYGGTNPEQEKQITKFNVPETPTQILYNVASENVFVSLANGDILMYNKDHEEWNLHHYKTISLDNDRKTISCMLPINFNIYAASGKRIFVFNGTSGDFQKSFEIQHINSDVNLMAHAGVGLWISLKHSSVICLYHTETFKHLQDINIAPHILRVTSSNNSSSNSNSSPSIYVTALMACKGMLWVGTNVGISLTVPLPRLEGVPIISGNVNISYHAHCGPVTFFQPLITKSANNQVTQTTPKLIPSSMPIDDTNNNIEINNKNGHVNNHNNINGKELQQQQQQHNNVTKLEKQKSLEVQPSPSKMKNQLSNSPIVLRRKSHIRECDLARMSKTLPRGFSGINNYFNGSNSMRSSSSSGSSQNGSDSGCDVYGLYSDLLFVKEDFDGQMIMTPNIHENSVYSTLRRGNSDPDLAAIPSKVSTLDRRLKMKVGRPRSLDLSNWSMDSRSSSLYTSSGSEESMGVKYRSVSRNSSNASHKFNGGELMNINEHCDHQATSTPNKEAEPIHQEVKETNSNFSAATLKNNKRKNLKNNYHQQMIDGRRTVMMLMGGRGYVNWRNVFNTPPNSSVKGNANGINGDSQKHLRSNSVTTINYKMLNSTDANIIIWEKKL